MDLSKATGNKWFARALSLLLGAALGTGVTYLVLTRAPDWAGSEAVINSTLEAAFLQTGATPDQAKKLAPCVSKHLVESLSKEGSTCCLAPPTNAKEVGAVLNSCVGPEIVMVLMQCVAETGIE